MTIRPLQRGMRHVLTVPALISLCCLAVAAGLLPYAYDWRSPLFTNYRLAALIGLVAIPALLIAVQIAAMRGWKSRLVLTFGAAGLIALIAALTTTLAREAQFRWMRHQVLSADPARLERIGRHIVVGYRDASTLRMLVERRMISGVFIASRNIEGQSVDDIRRQVSDLQDIRQRQGLPPLWIATDQEGGGVSRLSPPLPRMPPLSEVVSRTDPASRDTAVRDYASRQGQELVSVGINVNFAPVADLNNHIVNPKDRHSLIYRRAISDDAKVVADTVSTYCEGLQATGVHCTLKHFPGLGRVFEDTHDESASLGASVAELTTSDWIPFRTALHDSRAFMMLAHARLLALDRDHPASFSKPVIAGLLRGDWKYDGVLITDDFSMSAVYYSNDGAAQAAIASLNAGTDLILIAYDPDLYFPVTYALLQADADGRLDGAMFRRSDARLERAARVQR
jgi:beta-N-acetylhexosaminidase